MDTQTSLETNEAKNQMHHHERQLPDEPHDTTMLESGSNDEDRVLNIVEAPRREFARQRAELSWGGDAGQQFVHSTELLIAIDGGGTRTRCVVFDRIGNILAKTETGPSNHLVMDEKLALRSVAE